MHDILSGVDGIRICVDMDGVRTGGAPNTLNGTHVTVGGASVVGMMMSPPKYLSIDCTSATLNSVAVGDNNYYAIKKSLSYFVNLLCLKTYDVGMVYL